MTALWGVKTIRLATQKTRKDRKSHRLSAKLLWGKLLPQGANSPSFCFLYARAEARSLQGKKDVLQGLKAWSAGSAARRKPCRSVEKLFSQPVWSPATSFSFRSRSARRGPLRCFAVD